MHCGMRFKELFDRRALVRREIVGDSGSTVSMAIKRLNSRIRINAEHGCVHRRVQRQPNDIGRLGLEIRIVRARSTLVSPSCGKRPSERRVFACLSASSHRSAHGESPPGSAITRACVTHGRKSMIHRRTTADIGTSNVVVSVKARDRRSGKARECR